MARIPPLIGKYAVQRLLGKGGMGEVYLARDPNLDRLVAIKLVKEGVEDDEYRQRFEREARAVGRLRHPNIVVIYEFGEHDHQPFIAMEYLAGETLADLIRRSARLPLTRKLELMEDLCAGLAYAHRSKIVHRDIKPLNLILDEEGVLKILDFGIARLGDSTMTQSGKIIGSVNYMSPEQISAVPLDTRSDIFSVAAVMYEFLSGQQAFPGSLHEVVIKIIQSDPVPLSDHLPGLDPELEEIVNRGLKKDARDRYQALKTMRGDLVRVRQRLEASSAEGETLHAAEEVPTVVLSGPPPGSGRATELEAHLAAARVALQQGKARLALQRAEQALAIDAANPRARGIADEAEAAVRADDLKSLLDEAAAHLRAGDLTAAQQLLDKGVALEPGSEEAAALQRQVQTAGAERERARALERDVQSALERARSRFEEGAFEAAVRAAGEALAFDADNADALELVRQAESAIAAKRREDAEREAAREAERRRERRRRTMADARARLHEGDLAGAQALVAELLEGEPDDDDARALAAEVAEIQQQADSALSTLRTTIQEGRYGEAAEALERVRRLAPLTPELSDLTARLKAGQMELRAAVEAEKQEAERKRQEAHQREIEARQHQAELDERDDWARTQLMNARRAVDEERVAEALATVEEVRRVAPAAAGLDETLTLVRAAQAAAEQVAQAERARLRAEARARWNLARDRAIERARVWVTDVRVLTVTGVVAASLLAATVVPDLFRADVAPPADEGRTALLPDPAVPALGDDFRAAPASREPVAEPAATERDPAADADRGREPAAPDSPAPDSPAPDSPVPDPPVADPPVAAAPETTPAVPPAPEPAAEPETRNEPAAPPPSAEPARGPVDAPAVETTPPAEPDSASVVPAATPEVPAATPDVPVEPVADPPVPAVSDEDAVQAVLEDYRRAYEALDASRVAAVQALTPDELDRLAQSFTGYASQAMTFTEVNVIALTDRSATVSVRGTRIIEATAGRAPSGEFGATFTLEKRNGSWIIVSARYER